MAERAVTHIVEQERGADEAPLICDVVIVAEELAATANERIEDARSDGERAERVTEPRVFRRREGEIRKAELPQAAQSLDDREIEETRLRCG